MEHSARWERSRYLSFLLVLAFHAALFIVLVVSSRTRLLTLSAKSPIELLFLPPAPRPRVQSDVPSVHHARKVEATSPVPPSLTPAVPASPKGNPAASTIDWGA